MGTLRPQKGPQEKFLSTPADIAIYGGAAGGGKTFSILMECARNIGNPDFRAAIFRKTSKQIFNQGGLWDASMKVYTKVNGTPIKSPNPMWVFPSGATIALSHIGRDTDVFNYQGAEIALICFDELTHFSDYSFFYMLSRNRSTSGVKPYVRATCNPDVDSWVADFISWWIDPETGYPIEERGGKLRYFIRSDNKIIWGSSEEELIDKGYAKADIKSVTFIPSKLEDNKILMERDPSYLANLKALSRVEQERLLNGNWKIKPAAGQYFKRSEVEIIPTMPTDIISVVRGWDLAATSDKEGRESAKTAGVLLGKRRDGTIVVLDVKNEALGPANVRRLIYNTTVIDNMTYKGKIKTVIPQDPGQAGKEQVQSYIKLLQGYSVKGEAQTGSKITRAEPFSAQWQAGNVQVLEAEWTKEYIEQLESFPESKLKDMVDASGSAFNELAKATHYSPPTMDNAIIGQKKGWKI